MQFEATVDLTIAAGALGSSGLSFGIAHSGPGTCTITGIVEGAGSAATNGGDGAQFFAPAILAGGVTLGLIVQVSGNDVFDPGATHEVAKLTIEATIPEDGCVTCELSFTDTLGSPVVSTVVVAGGVALTPAQTNQATSLCSAVQACCFPTGACGEIGTPEDCVSFGGTPQGADSDCATSGCSACPSDLDGNGEVRVPDLIKLLGDWGQCPAPILAVCTESDNDCCTASPDDTPGCNNSACCDCICACDPFCCGLNTAGTGVWDFNCAGCGFLDSPCGASNPNSGCADVCSACVDPGMCE